jgi:hypothetical protein
MEELLLGLLWKALVLLAEAALVQLLRTWSSRQQPQPVAAV